MNQESRDDLIDQIKTNTVYTVLGLNPKKENFYDDISRELTTRMNGISTLHNEANQAFYDSFVALWTQTPGSGPEWVSLDNPADATETEMSYVSSRGVYDYTKLIEPRKIAREKYKVALHNLGYRISSENPVRYQERYNLRDYVPGSTMYQDVEQLIQTETHFYECADSLMRNQQWLFSLSPMDIAKLRYQEIRRKMDSKSSTYTTTQYINDIQSLYSNYSRAAEFACKMYSGTLTSYINTRNLPALRKIAYEQYQKIIYHRYDGHLTQMTLTAVDVHRDGQTQSQVSESGDSKSSQSTVNNVFSVSHINELNTKLGLQRGRLHNAFQVAYEASAEDYYRRLSNLTKKDVGIQVLLDFNRRMKIEENLMFRCKIESTREIRIKKMIFSELLLSKAMNLIEDKSTGLMVNLQNWNPDTVLVFLRHFNEVTCQDASIPTVKYGKKFISVIYAKMIDVFCDFITYCHSSVFAADINDKQGEMNAFETFATEIRQILQAIEHVSDIAFLKECMATKIGENISKNLTFEYGTAAEPRTIRTPEKLIEMYTNIMLNEIQENSAFMPMHNNVVFFLKYVFSKDKVWGGIEDLITKRIFEKNIGKAPHELWFLTAIKRIADDAYYASASKLIRFIREIIESREPDGFIGTYEAMEGNILGTTLTRDIMHLKLVGNYGYESPMKQLIGPFQVLANDFTKYFDEAYNKTSAKRVLSWEAVRSRCEIEANFKTSRKKLNCSLIQGNILMVFMDRDTATVQEIMDILRISEIPIVKIAILGIIHVVCEKQTILNLTFPTENKGITFDTIVEFNPNFKSKMRNLMIPTPEFRDPVKEKKREENIMSQRECAIDAAIVRKMKSVRTLPHQELIIAVVTMIKLFSADPGDIRKRIDYLIDREFLERDPDDRRILNYLA